MRACRFGVCSGLALLLLASAGCMTAADKKLGAAHEKMYAVNRQMSEVSLKYAKASAELAARLYVAEKALYDLDYQDFLDSHSDETGRLVSLDQNGQPAPVLRSDIEKANELYRQRLQDLDEKRRTFLDLNDEYIRQLRLFGEVTATSEETEKILTEARQSAQAILQHGLSVGGVALGAALPK